MIAVGGNRERLLTLKGMTNTLLAMKRSGELVRRLRQLGGRAPTFTVRYFSLDR